ncbi:MAG TPA: DALR anticodon-binding domain-containing protein [Streptosporangiaceae bacterium]
MITKNLLRYSDKWFPGGTPGVYVSRLVSAEGVVSELTQQPWVATATTSDEYLTVTVTRDALAHVAVAVVQAGNQCVTSDALHGTTVCPAPPADLDNARDWASARDALAAEFTTELAVAAGATLHPPERQKALRTSATERSLEKKVVADAIAYAGLDAVRFALARTPPGGPAPDPERIARHVLSNPAYAVRYAHAAAAAVLRWADKQPGEFRPGLLAEPGELAQPEPTAQQELTLLDALSWLPERVAAAARRGRPDQFTRYLEALASRTIDTMSTTSYRVAGAIPSERLWLAEAARTGLAAGLGLLGITAPDRI